MPFFIKGSLTRPNDTTAYASGDLIANSTTAGSVVPILCVPPTGARWGLINGIIIRRTAASVVGLEIRAHIFVGDTAPTVTSGDNAAMVIATGTASYIGFIAADIAQAITTGAVVSGNPVAGRELHLKGDQNIHVLLEARGAIVPAANEVFSLELLV